MELINMMTVLFLITSPIACFLSNNWLLIWVCLEISTLTFSFLVSHTTKETKEAEVSLKYFLIQSSASTLLLFMLVTNSTNVTTVTEKILLTLVLILKVGCAPFHLWFFTIGKKMSWKMLSVLMSWQKVAPLYLMMFSAKVMLLLTAIITMMIGTVIQYKNKNMKLIMIYSGISNNCWILIMISMNIMLLLVFSSVYFLSVILMNKVISNKTSTASMFSMKEDSSLTNSYLFILMLAGMPPTIAFMPKWMLFKEFVSLSMTTLAIFLLVFTTINFYIYLRLFLKTLSKKESHLILKSTTSYVLKSSSLTLSLFGLLLVAC